ncbi:uncharacterized protein M421DRAFT_283533 [Didymella exigua CBS 183.55]|uniref:Uncharacterized protein n=1 Tax=Didymella exigua CBS 183.55 TaxID=1150837 RepID=A0A6A5S0P7_9PLEO|nr:uncharacterized protein M421DRAFT_283533 [Didymella exigua CBS 183.55]KAF1932056.1 hypothetical protein M421DRAFT_283533 [Didymella exigua CBS 183.55]
MNISQVAAWSQGDTNGRLKPMVTTASQNSRLSAAKSSTKSAFLAILRASCSRSLARGLSRRCTHHRMYASFFETRIVQQYAEPDNQVSRITAFVSGANACSVHNTPTSMGHEPGWLSVAIGFDPGEEVMSLTERPRFERASLFVSNTSSPCVDLQILKRHGSTTNYGDGLSTAIQLTTCCTCRPCIGRITSLLGVNAHTADCMSARYGQVCHGLLASLRTLAMGYIKALNVTAVRSKPPMDLQDLNSLCVA